MSMLDDQGHGMRAFFNVALPVIAASVPIILIDEPELFLHPPQVRRLAEVLARYRQSNGQVIVSTHSSDIVQGFITACEGQALDIIRLTRRGESNRVQRLSPETVRPLYTDPLLRHSTVLDGLFYHGVAVCEAEGDSAYFSAVDQHARTTGPSRDDIHFTYALGNGRVANAVRPLRDSGIPVASIIDCDTLLDSEIVRRLVAAHRMEFDPLRERLESVQGYVQDSVHNSQPTRESARETIMPILERTDPELSPLDIEAISAAIKERAGRKLFKVKGWKFFDGDAAVADSFRSLTEMLAEGGIFVVPAGELESFHPKVSRKRKSAWIARVLGDEALYRERGDQHAFIASVRDYLHRMTKG